MQDVGCRRYVYMQYARQAKGAYQEQGSAEAHAGPALQGIEEQLDQQARNDKGAMHAHP
jgi:hypothetical protein